MSLLSPEWVSLAASLVSVSRSGPQIVAIIKSHDVSGVSASTWILLLINSIAWELIGIAYHSQLVMFFNFLNGMGALCILMLLAWRGSIAAWFPVIIGIDYGALSWGFWGRAGVSLGGMFLSLCLFMPQAWRVTRMGVAGVSALSWWFALSGALLWIVYGTIVNAWVFIIPSLFMAPLATFILFHVYRLRGSTQLVTD